MLRVSSSLSTYGHSMVRPALAALLISVITISLSCVPSRSFVIDHDTGLKDYTGHHVIRVIPVLEEHVHLVHALQRQHSPEVQFWKAPTEIQRFSDLQVSPHVFTAVSNRLKRSGVRFQLITDNVQRLIEDERSVVSSEDGNSILTTTTPQTFDLNTYHTYEEIMEWLNRVAVECGETCQISIIGYSLERRPIKVVKIGADSPSKPVIWIDAGLHAREWIAPATALFIINKLIQNGDDMSLKNLITNYTFYISPLGNPDGYRYTWTRDRLWRKNRSRHPTSRCRGTDPNRNWNFHWGDRGTSSEPCSENYRGALPFSEPEARHMANFIWSIRQRIAAYVSLHSYGQYWLTPWGYTTSLPTDYQDLVSLGNIAARAIRSINGTEYLVGSSSRLLYLAPGGSDDWVKGVAGVKYSYTVELTDNGRYGFFLPPSYINSTGHEMLKAITTLATEIQSRQSNAL